jgi:hypothetical protein
MKRLILFFLIVVMASLPFICAFADRFPEEKGPRYIGAMQVIRCKEYVTLRAEPYKKSRALAKVPLGAVVYNCRSIREKKSFLYAEYEGVSGYILAEYLEKAPQYEPAVTSAVSGKLTEEEIRNGGEIVLDWQDYNISVLASHGFRTEGKKKTEILLIGCFIDGEPLWGHTETLEVFNDLTMLRVFIGGTEDDPMVMVYDGGYGLSLLDLLSGKERWLLTTANCKLGDGAVTAVGESGNIFISGTDGPDLTAVSPDGRLLWTVSEDYPGFYDPAEIILNKSSIQVRFRSGMENAYILATFDYSGDLIESHQVN